MEKLPGVESATVTLNEGRAVLQLKPDNQVTIAQVRERVRRNGFTPRDAVVTARAEAVVEGERLRLRITGTEEIFDVRTTVANLERLLRSGSGRHFVVEGTVPVPQDAKTRPVLEVTAATPAGRRN
jgi:hypothetical protein